MAIRYYKNGLITISSGNRKLIENENTKFMVFNLPAVKTCPFATPHCIKNCYALKAEIYPTARTARENNYKASLTKTFVLDMSTLINETLKKQSYKNAKQIIFRIHESGDFYNQEYFNDWIAIAAYSPNIKFIAYTKSIKYALETEYTIPKNFIITASIWDDSPEYFVKAAFENFKIYTAYNEFTVDHLVKNENYQKCRCEDCATCQKCFVNNKSKIACIIH